VLLHENDGKQVLRHFGIPTPSGVEVETTSELSQALLSVGMPAVLKAQVPTGGRGKAGGILFAENDAQARAAFSTLLKSKINGFRVSKILVEPKVKILHERYVGITVSANRAWLMIGRAGGISIEERANDDPSSVVRIPVDRESDDLEEAILKGLRGLGLSDRANGAYATVCKRLLDLFIKTDALTAEINPLAELEDGSLVALDARIDVDDSALPRQPAIRELLQLEPSATGWGKSKKESTLTRLQDGVVGLIGLGGGMAMAVSDWFAGRGFGLSGTIDMDCALASGQAQAVISSVLSDLDEDRDTKVILLNMISSGNRIDRIVSTILPVLQARGTKAGKPLVVHLQGNGGAEATRMLRDAGLPNFDGLKDALHATVEHLGAAR